MRLAGVVVFGLSVLVVSSAGCSPDEVAAPALGRWVAIDPIQCLGNPWEVDWLASHGGPYPGDPTTPELEPEEEAVIRDYYHRRGVVVLDLESSPWNVAVCEACSCPQGYTLYLLVRPADLETMIALGFREESPG